MSRQPSPKTFVEVVQKAATSHPHKVAYTFLADGEQDAGSLNYGELDREARVLAQRLLAVAQPGERALLLYPPGLEYVVAFYACLYSGIIAVPVYPPRPNSKLERVSAIVNDSQAKLALSTTGVAGQLASEFTEVLNLKGLLWLETDLPGSRPGPAPVADLPNSPRPDDIAFLQYTSGSTATPKGVIVSHTNLLHNVKAIAEIYGSSEKTIAVSWIPIYHDMGLIGMILSPILCGGRVVFMSPAAFLQRPLRWLQAITRFQGTLTAAPNFAYALCIRKVTQKEKSELNLSHWRSAVNGAEPVREQTVNAFLTTFAECGLSETALRPSYGLAEVTLVASASRAGERFKTIGFDAELLEKHHAREAPSAADARTLVSCGPGLRDQQIVIVDPENLRPCTDLHVGEIWVKGPSVAQGYWGRPELSAATFQARIASTGEGPFLRTGDLGFLREGELFVTGRIKDLIVINGRNHYPQDIELTVERTHPSFRQGGGAAFSIESDGEERLVIVHEIERSQIRSLDTEDLSDRVRQAVAEEHEIVVHAIEFLKPMSLPKTSSGKVQRGLCRSKFLSGTLDVVPKRCQPVLAVSGNETEQTGPVAAPGDAADAMQFSLFYFSANEGEFQNDKYRLFLEGSRFADEHGFAAVWVPERHFHAFGGIYPNPSILGSALAVTTKNIRIRAGSVVLPLHNPIRVAEEWSAVDNLSGGRVDLAFARGWNPNDFVLAPQNYANSLEVLYRDLETVRKLWRGESIPMQNGKGQETQIRIFPLPHQREISVWLTCSGGKERFVEAGTGGWNVLTALLFQSADELREKISAYRDARRKNGHAPKTGRVTLMLHTFLGEDEHLVKEQVRAPFIEYLKTSVDLWRHGSKDLASLNEDERRDVLNFAFERYYRTGGLFGTPESCRETVADLRKAGVDEIACLIDFGVPVDAALKGLQAIHRLAQKCGGTVHPITNAPGFAAGKPASIPAAAAVTAADPGADRLQSDAVWDERAPGNRAMLRWIKNVIGGEIARVTRSPLDRVSYTKNFLSLGIDSLKAIEIIEGIQKQLGLKLLPALLFEFPTVEQLASGVARQNRAHLLARVPEAVAISSSQPAAHVDDVEVEPGRSPVASVRSGSSDDIAIIGMACRFPGAPNLDSYWDLMASGRDVVTEVPPDHWDWRAVFSDDPNAENKTYSRWGGFLDNIDLFDAGFFNLSPREARLLDPQQRIILEIAWHTFEHAGYAPENLSGSSVGVFLGASYNGYYQQILHSLKQSDHGAGVGNQNAIIANRVSYALNLDGPSILVDTLCSSSLVALHVACQSLKNGECSLALAGGINILLSPENYVAMSRMKAHSPNGRCKAFDHRADGICFGEGAGCVLLKPLAHAVSDGDTVYAIVKASALNHGGRANGLLAPNPRAQSNLVRRAMQSAGIAPESISYIEAHGTGTALGDPIEIEGLTKAFLAEGGSRPQSCAIGSVKSNIGHLESAAGIAGIIKVVLAMQHRQLPPTLHFQKANPLIDFENSPFRVQRELSGWNPSGPRFAGVSSFGIGGSNAHVILQEPSSAEPRQNQFGRPGNVLVLSAKSETALRALAADYISYLDSSTEPLSDVCFTANAGRTHFIQRLAVTGDTSEVVKQKLQSFIAARPAHALYSGQIREDEKPVIAFLFTGQGSQYAGMGKHLYETEATFRQSLDLCGEILSMRYKLPLLDQLFAPDGGNDFAVDAVFAQTALFALEYALVELWRSWDVIPDIVMGHSLGEYAAALAAGVFSLEDGLMLVAERARLMQDRALRRGSMAAVFASQSVVEQYLPMGAGEVSIAAVNGPNHVVISGVQEGVRAILEKMAEREIIAEELKVTHAFHSPLMEPVLREFENTAAKVNYRSPQLPLISNLTGQNFKAGAIPDAGYWARHLREPVQFEAGVSTLAEQGCSIVLEIGPSAPLLGMVRRCLQDRKLSLVPSLQIGKRDWDVLLDSIARLYVAGVRIDWSRFDLPYDRRRIPLPSYPFERRRFWIDRDAGQSDAGEVHRAPGTNQGDTAKVHTNGRLPSKEAVAATPLQNRRESILSLLRRSLAGFLEMEESHLDDHKSFLAMGSDSLVLIEAIQDIQETFGIKLSIRQLFEETTTLSALAEYIDGNLRAEAAFAGWPPAKPQSAAGPGPQASTNWEDEQPSGLERTSPSIVAAQPTPSQAHGSHMPGTMLERVVAQQLAAMNQLAQQQLRVLAGSPPDLATQSPEPAKSWTGNRVNESPAPELSQYRPSASAEDRVDATVPNTQPWVPYQPLNPGSIDDLTPSQQSYLRTFIAGYSARTRLSKASTQRYRRHHADLRAAMSFRLCTKEIRYPIVGARSEGSVLIDIDGNRYVDFTMGYGVNLFGHNPPFVMEAIRNQMEKGIHVGPQAELAGEVADLFCELTGMERATFCNSGTEAVMAALRIARVSTGKPKVAIFAGSYHGTSDGVLVSAQRTGGQLRAVPMVPGLPPGMAEDMVVLNYNNAKSLAILESSIHQFAAVLVEPVQSRRPDLQPREFLQKLRKITRDAGVVLIFDEVITGFRVHPRGAQGWFGVQADLATYGKVVGGGLPIGVVAGKAGCMDSIDGGMWSFGDASVPAVKTTLYTGTFCKHPLAMAAAKAVLLELKRQGPALFDRLDSQTERLAQRLNEYLVQARVPIDVVRFGSLFRLGGPLQLMSSDALDLLYYHLIHNGVYVWEGRNWFLSTAHTEADHELLLEVMRQSVTRLQEAGFIPSMASSHGRGAALIASSPDPGGAQPSDRISLDAVRLTIPSTPQQRDLWLLSHASKTASLSYNQSVCLRLRGPLQLEALESALERVSSRHESLRTVFSANGELLTVFSTLQPRLQQIDLSTSAAPEQEHLLSQWLEGEAQATFTMAGAPLWRVTLLRLGDFDHVFMLTIHHTIADGWSIGVLLQEIGALYSAALEGRQEELPPALQFRDYTEYINGKLEGPKMAAAEGYWLKELELPPLLSLPLDHARSQSRDAARFQQSIDPALASQLRSVSAQIGSTLFMTLLAAYKVFLAELTGQTDIVVVTPVAGQSQMSNFRLIGDCSNLMASRCRIDSHPRFSDFVQSIKSSLVRSSSYQLFPFAQLVRKLRPQRDPAQWPFFNIDRPLSALKFSGLSVADMAFPIRYANFDFGLNVTIVGEKIDFSFDYKTALFRPQTIEQWSRRFEALLWKVVKNPGLSLFFLPQPELVANSTSLEPAGAYAAPRTQVEEILQTIWAEVFGKERVSIFADFFDLGGHSLLATQIVSRVREIFAVELALEYLFQQPSIAGLAAYLESGTRHRDESIDQPVKPAIREGALPLSSSQRRLWLIDQLQPGNTAYNMVGALRLFGPVDFAVLRRALDEIARRHESLRTVFPVIAGAACQEVQPAQPVDIEKVDLFTLPECDRGLAIAEQGRELARRPFNLAKGPLLRIRLLDFGGEDRALVLTVHHIVSDGWSMGILLKEFSALYAAFSSGSASPLPEPAVQFADYAVWEQARLASGSLRGSLDYWLKHLQGVPPFLSLPTDRPRTAAPGFRGAHEPFSLDASLTAELDQLCRQEGISLFMALLAAISLLLHRDSGQDDFVIGTDIANRNRVEIENLIGCFVNLLPLRMELAGDPTFREYLRRVRRVTLGAYAHQNVPFDYLIRELRPERKLTSTPLIQVLFVLQNAPLDVVNPGTLRMELVPVHMETAEFELIFNIDADKGPLSGAIGYTHDLFERGTVQTMVMHLKALLAEIVSNPESRISCFSVLSEREKAAYSLADLSHAQLSQKDLDKLLLRLQASSGK